MRSGERRYARLRLYQHNEACVNAQNSIFRLYLREVKHFDDVGVIDLNWLEGALATPTLFCSIGYVNNEIGTIQPLEKISELLRQNGALFHSDCAQAPKTLSCDQLVNCVDLASFSGHKIGGPPGIIRLEMTQTPALWM